MGWARASSVQTVGCACTVGVGESAFSRLAVLPVGAVDGKVVVEAEPREDDARLAPNQAAASCRQGADAGERSSVRRQPESTRSAPGTGDLTLSTMTAIRPSLGSWLT
jgi:hypothetical protein